MNVSKSFFTLICLSIMVMTACKKDRMLTSGGELGFSTDTLMFDTVFTEYNSFTLSVKIFNRQDQPVNISSVRLQQGAQSFFKLNVNGIPGHDVRDLELAPEDSLYVFATVHIDPTDEDNPFIVEDRLIATLNGQDFSIPMYAYGQNAYYIRDSVISVSDVWKTDRPYVIMHSALVAIGATLTIPPGTRIFMHADSRLYVQGRLLCGIGGSAEDTVVFQGDRLDRGYFGYKGYPGEWGGLYFDSSSTGNILEWTVVKNCGNNIAGGLPFAIEVFGYSGIGRQLTLRNTIIENSLGYGLLCFEANVYAENSLISNCGTQTLALFQGGNYEMNNCNFINYQRERLDFNDQPSAVILNYFPVSESENIPGDLQAVFRNCVFYGSLDNELFADRIASATFDLSIHNSLIRVEDELPDYVALKDVLINVSPEFVSAEKKNYRLKPESPLVNAGTPLPFVTVDLDGNLRTSDSIDIGCFEYVSE